MSKAIADAKKRGWVRSSSLVASDLAKAIRALHAQSLADLKEDLKHPAYRFFNTRTGKFSGAATWSELP